MNTQAQGAPAPTVFQFQPFTIRVVADENGNPWFCAKDVCGILGYTNDSKAIKDHCKSDGVTNRYPIIDTLGRQQFPAFINEGNLYRLIIKSRKPEAEKFESWVCDEVLPAIRKTGRYVHREARPAAAPLGDAAQWVVREYTQSLGRYLNRSTQQISPRLHAHLRARFGVGNVRDIPADRLDELLNVLEQFHDQAYGLWWVCLNLELALLQTLHVAAYETRTELPPAVREAMTACALPGDKGGAAEAIRQGVLQRLRR
jgi:prophage antirepressor-like protein